MLHIKDATTADIPVIQALTYKIWPATYQSLLSPEQIDYMLDMMYSTTSLTRQLSELQHRFLLLYDDGQPIGFASYSTTTEDGVFKLHKIYLDQTRQGQGIGKFLLNAVIDRVTAAGAHTLELDVNRQNKARHFYEKLGFSIHKEKDTDIGNGFLMTDYIMRRNLLPGARL